MVGQLLMVVRVVCPFRRVFNECPQIVVLWLNAAVESDESQACLPGRVKRMAGVRCQHDEQHVKISQC